MTERDEVRDQIAHAMGWTTGHFGDVLDAVMAVVDPIMQRIDVMRIEASDAATEARQTIDALAWLHAEAVWQRDEAARSARDSAAYAELGWTETEQLRARVADLEGQLAAANAKLRHAQTYADNCAKHAAVEVLRGDVAWHLRQIVTQPPHNCADASCVYNGPDEPGPDARVWARGAPQPDGVTHVRERGERHWCLGRTDNLWYMRDIAGPMLPWDDLLEGCGWVVEMPPVRQP